MIPSFININKIYYKVRNENKIQKFPKSLSDINLEKCSLTKDGRIFTERDFSDFFSKSNFFNTTKKNHIQIEQRKKIPIEKIM